RLWEVMKPETVLEDRYTRQWQEIGFQGKDPSTDFRGMGLLGLEDLLYYGVRYPDLALRTLEGSKSNPESWYSYAIVGINITSFAVECLHNRSLQYFLFRYGTSMDIYHEFYCYLFASFHHHWITRVPRPTIMQFTPVFEEFKSLMRIDLQERRPIILDEASPVL
ncbi:Engulfment/cell motility, partial [Piptocephalis cylindrospora]